MTTQVRVNRSEWIKLRTVRSTWFAMAAAVLGVVGLGLLVSYLNAAHWATLSAADRHAFNPVNQSLLGVNFAQLAIGVLGVLAATGEYSTGTIRTTFAAVPRRLPVLLAKVGVLAAVTFVVCLSAVSIAFMGGQALLGKHGLSLVDSGGLRAVFGATVYLTGVAVMGVGLGFLIRSTAGGVATLVGLLFVLPIMAAGLSGGGHGLDRYLPSTAGRALFIVNSEGAMLEPWRGLVIFLLYIVIAVGAAALALRRRDA